VRAYRLVPLLGLAVLSGLALSASSLLASGTPAYVHDAVREQLAANGEARVIAILGDPKVSSVWEKKWQDRAPAVHELAQRALAAAPGLRVNRGYDIFPFLAVTVDQVTLEQLIQSPVVEAVYPDRRMYATLHESGPLIGQPEAELAGYDGGYHGPGVGPAIGIAILDTGLDYTHPDISTSPYSFPNNKMPGGTDLVNGDSDPMDDNGHGTHVAGIAAGRDLYYRGIAPNAQLIAVKVLDATGSGYSSTVMAGIEWCITNQHYSGDPPGSQLDLNIQAINLSLGDQSEWTNHEECDAEPEAQAIQDAVNAGIFVAVAAGNSSYLHGVSMPACASAAAAVAATKDGTPAQPDAQPVDGIASYTDRGEMISIFAPGSVITSAHLGGGFITEEGTSMATPHVAGAAALMVQLGISDPVEIKRRLILTGHQILDPFTNIQTPRVDLVQAIAGPPASGPDLVVTSVSTTATTVTYGDPITVSLTVKNQGDTASGACSAVVGLSANTIPSPQDPGVITLSVGALAAGASQTFTSVTGVVPDMPAGMYYLIGFADSDYVVVEKDYTNNGLMGSQVRVGMTSLVVGNSIPAFMLKGQTYPVSVNMKNDGDIAWNSADGVQLGATSPEDTARWGITRVPLPSSSVIPGQAALFNFSVTAPSQAGWYPSHWQMAKNESFFGEVATGATKVLVKDDTLYGQSAPAASGERVAYEDYSGQTGQSVSVTDINTMGTFMIPDNVLLPTDSTGIPLPPYEYFDISFHYIPDLWHSWVTWVVDDYPNADYSLWYYQVAAFNVDSPYDLPRRITYRAADAVYPAIDGSRVVWMDFRNDPDHLFNGDIYDRCTIYIYDMNTWADYPLTTAIGPKYDPRISGDLVVWEDWRDGQPDIYMYDLSVDSNGNGIPNWKETVRPDPDPAERQLTNTPYWEMYPDVSGRIVVWMDMRRDPGSLDVIDIYSLNVDTMVETAVAADPKTVRLQPRIDGTQVVWEDYRFGAPDIYFADSLTGASVPIAGSAGIEIMPDIGNQTVAYAKYRLTAGTPPNQYDVYNIVAQRMFLHAAVGVHTFTDVLNTYWAWSYIEAIAQNGVSQGYPAGDYRPGLAVTRDQMAVYISRALVSPSGDAAIPPGPPEATFSDVPTDYWAYKWVEYAVANSIVGGYGDGTYRPTEQVDRAQMAVFVARAIVTPHGDEGLVGYTPPATPTFSDVGTGYWAYKYIEYIAQDSVNVTQGYPGGTYRPETVVTRDQMAVYVSRAFGYSLP
jgi:beta propeller repeat protein